MPLAFLFSTPFLALFTAVAAASVPIVIHLLNRRRYRIVPWAAMRFLLAAQRRTVRRLRIEQWVLLAVRTLLIVLLVGAMVSVRNWADPLWNRLFPGGKSVGAARSGRTHRILAIDGSFSMGLRHDDGLSFERAKRRAEEIVAASSPGDGFSLVLLGSPATSIVPGPSDDAGKVTQEIQNLRLPHGSSDLAGGLAVIEKMLGPNAGKYQQREVIVLTDMQRGFFEGGTKNVGGKADEGKTGVEPDTWQRLQGKARVIVVDVGRDGAENAGITNLALADPLALTRYPNAVTVTVHNFGVVDRTQLRVELLAGRVKSDDADEPFNLRVLQQELIAVPAGVSVPVTFPLAFPKAGDYVLQARIEPDALDLDDTRSLTVTVKDAVPVLLVNGKPTAVGDDQPTHHVNFALNPFPKALRSPSPFRPTVLPRNQFDDPTLGDLNPYDCVVLADVPRLTDREVTRLESFVQRGGGLIIALGPQADLEAYNRDLWRGGQGLLPARLVGRVRAPEDQFFNLAADDEAFQQPPLSSFSGDGDRAALLGARLRQYVRVEAPQAGAARRVLSFLPPKYDDHDRPSGSAARAGGLDAAILERPKGRGRVVLVTTTLNTEWGTWPGSTAFLPLVHELTRFAIQAPPARTVAVGEPLVEYLPPNFVGVEATVTTPDDRTIPVTVQELNDVAAARCPETDVSGLYRLAVGSGRERIFAVNVPTATGALPESDLGRIEPSELKSPDGDLQVVREPSQIKRTAHEPVSADSDEGPRSSAGPWVAKILTLTFFILLFVEMALAWLFGAFRSVASGGAAPSAVRALGLGTLLELSGFLLIGVCAGIGLVLLHEALTGQFLGFLPGSIRLATERALGVPDAAPGEGTRWRLEYLAYLSGTPKADRWLGGFLGLVCIAVSVLIYQLERIVTRVRAPGENAGPRSVFAPAGLRVSLFGLTLAVLLPQLRVAFEREGWPDVVLLVDTSRSMSHADDFQDEKVRTKADALLKSWAATAESERKRLAERIEAVKAARDKAEGEKKVALDAELTELDELSKELNAPQRINLIKALTAGSDDWIDRLLTKRQVKVHVYRCATKTERVAEVAEPGKAADGRTAIRELRATGETSQLGGAVRAVLNDFRGGSLGAIILLSDGVVTEGEGLASSARHAARADVPLFLVGVGDAHEPRDLVLHDLAAEDSVNVRDRLVFQVRVTARGNLAAKSVPVTLWEKKGTELKPLDSKDAVLEPGKPVQVKLTHSPTESGDKTYVITVPEQPDETDRTNNRIERQVHVADAKPVRVLYIEGYPRYEFRFIKTLLEREMATARGSKSLFLRVLLCDADKDYPTQDKSAVGEFPSKEELYTYDAVILGDVDPHHQKLGERNLKLLRDFVRERGGGLLLIAGEQSAPKDYKGTPLADVLPVTWGDDTSDKAGVEAGLQAGYRPRLTPIGVQHPIFRFETEDAPNAAAWNKLSLVYWAAGGVRAKPSAEVLAVHPGVPVARSAGDTAPAFLPLAVQMFVGAGRSMFFGFDESWRWRFREDELRFNQFWLQTVRYLARTRVGRVDLRLDKQTPYRRHEPIRVTVRFPDDAPPPAANATVKVVAERRPLKKPGEEPAAPVETQTLQLVRLDSGKDGEGDGGRTFEALLTRTAEGEYRFWLAAPSVSGPRPHAEAKVLPPPGEMDRLRLDQTEMERAAAESRGKFYTLADADKLIDELPPGSRVTLNQPRPPLLLWNHPLSFMLVLGVMTTEWVLRKRRRLL